MEQVEFPNCILVKINEYTWKPFEKDGVTPYDFTKYLKDKFESGQIRKQK